ATHEMGPAASAATRRVRRPALSRREFCRVAGALAGLAALPRCSSSPSTRDQMSSALPSLGGAPDTHEGHTIAAFCDTVVPGRWRDPEGTPGALDTNAPALFFDPTLPALPYVGLLVILVDGYAGKVKPGAHFVDLVPDERDAAVAAAI